MHSAAMRQLACALAKPPRRQQAYLAASVEGFGDAKIATRLDTDIAGIERLLAAALIMLDDADQ